MPSLDTVPTPDQSHALLSISSFSAIDGLQKMKILLKMSLSRPQSCLLEYDQNNYKAVWFLQEHAKIQEKNAGTI